MPSILHSKDAIEVTAEFLASHGLRVGSNVRIGANGSMTLPNLTILDSVSIDGQPILLSNASACVSSIALRGTEFRWYGNGALTTAQLSSHGVHIQPPASIAADTLLFALDTTTRANVVTVNAAGVLHTHAPFVLADTLRTPTHLLLDTQRRLQNVHSLSVDQELVVGNTTLVVRSTPGAVGIGTAAPAYELDVVGRARFTTHLYSNAHLLFAADTRTLQNVATAHLDTTHLQQALVGNVLVLSSQRDLSNIASASLATATIGTLAAGNVAAQRAVVHDDLQLLSGPLRVGQDVVLAPAGGRHLSNIATVHLGAGALVLDPTGNVGVRTAAPAVDLDVHGTARVQQLERADGALVLSEEGHLSNITAAHLDHLEVGDGTLYVDANTTHIGVGTEAPTATLDVAGDLRFRDVLRGDVPFLTHDGHLRNLASLEVASSAFVVEPDGQVRISGLSLDDLTVQQQLVLDQDRVLSNITRAIIDGPLIVGGDALVVDATGNVTVREQVEFQGPVQLYDELRAANGDVLIGPLRTIDNIRSATIQETILVGQEIGVGTTDPEEMLDVAGTVRAEGLRIVDHLVLDDGRNLSNIAAADIHGPMNVFSTAYLLSNVVIGDIGGDPLELVHIAGNVRIDGNMRVRGTTTFVNTEVVTTSAIWITNDGEGPAGRFNQIGADRIFELQDDGVTVMVVNDGGFVGIGTDAPATELDLAGTLSIHGVPVLDENRVLSNVTLSTFDASRATQVVASRLDPFTGSLGKGLLRKVYDLPPDVLDLPEDAQEMNALLFRSTLSSVSVERSLVIEPEESKVHEFMGYLRVDEPGTYEFGLNAQDAVDFYLNNAAVADWYGSHVPRSNPNRPGGSWISVDLAAGYHRLYLRLASPEASPLLELYWIRPSAADFEPVPLTAFYLAGFDTICASSTGSETLVLGTVNATFSCLPVEGVSTCLYPPQAMTADEVFMSDANYGIGDYLVQASVNSADAWKAFQDSSQTSPNGWIVTVAPLTPVQLRLEVPDPIFATYMAVVRPLTSNTLYVRLWGEDDEGIRTMIPLQGRSGYVPIATAGDVEFLRTTAVAMYRIFIFEFRSPDAQWELLYLRMHGTETTPLMITNKDTIASEEVTQLFFAPEGRLGIRTDAPKETLDVTGGVVVRRTGEEGGFLRWEEENSQYALQAREGKFHLLTDTSNAATTSFLTWTSEGHMGVGALQPTARLDVRASQPLQRVPSVALVADVDPSGYIVSAPSAAGGTLFSLFSFLEADLLTPSLDLVDTGYVGLNGQYLGAQETLLENGNILRGAWIEMACPVGGEVVPARFEVLTRGVSVSLTRAPRHIVLLGSRSGRHGTWVRLAEKADLDPRDRWSSAEWTPEASPPYRFFRFVVRALWGSENTVTITQLRLFAQPILATTPALHAQGTVSFEQGNLLVETDATDATMTLDTVLTGFGKTRGGFSDGRFVVLVPGEDRSVVEIVDGEHARRLPSSALGAATSTLTGTALDGEYVVTSSEASPIAWHAFNADGATAWISSASYDVAQGTYVGAEVTVDAQGSSYAGEWLQLEVPDQVQLDYYIVQPSATTFADRGPQSWTLLGSEDGVVFHVLDRRSLVDGPVGTPQIFRLAGPVMACSVFRLVVHRVGHPGAAASLPRDRVELVRWQLFDTAVDPGAGTVVSLDVSTVHASARGFAGGCHDGEYGYLVPGGTHGLLIRFRMSTASHPAVLDLTATHTDLRSFRGACFDGRFLYLLPTLGWMPRVDTQTFQVSSRVTTGGNGLLHVWGVPELDGAVLSAGVVQDQYLYFVCEDRPVVGRVPVHAFETDPITTLSLAALGFEGFGGVCAINGYLYLVAQGAQEGRLTRLDVRSWTAGGSPRTMDLSTVDPVLSGFRGCVFDGRYGYLIPYRNAGGNHGNVVRWDPGQFPVWPRQDRDRMNLIPRTGYSDAAGFTAALVAAGRLWLLPSERPPTFPPGSTLVSLSVVADTATAGTARLASEQVILGRDRRSRVAVHGALRVESEGVDGGMVIDMATAQGPTALQILHPKFQHVFDGEGRVGIQTSHPTHTLDVHGSFAADGFTLRMGRERAYRFFEDTTVTAAAGTRTVGIRLRWWNEAVDVQQAFRVLARCTVVGSATQHAFRRVEVLVHPVPGTTTPGELVMLDSSMYLSAGFTQFGHRVVRTDDTSTDVVFDITGSVTSYRVSIDLEVIAPLELGKFVYEFLV